MLFDSQFFFLRKHALDITSFEYDNVKCSDSATISHKFLPFTVVHATVSNFLHFQSSFHDLLTLRKSNTAFSCYTFPSTAVEREPTPACHTKYSSFNIHASLTLSILDPWNLKFQVLVVFVKVVQLELYFGAKRSFNFSPSIMKTSFQPRHASLASHHIDLSFRKNFSSSIFHSKSHPCFSFRFGAVKLSTLFGKTSDLDGSAHFGILGGIFFVRSFALANIIISVGYAYFACEITKLWGEKVHLNTLNEVLLLFPFSKKHNKLFV